MAGPRGGRGRGRGHRGHRRGRGGRATAAARSPSPAPSSSSEEEARGFEFLIVLNDDPLGIQRLSDKFAEFVDSKEPAALQLREADCNFCPWPAEVLFDGRGKMYLDKGWEDFARVHNLQASCVVTFLYEGDEEMCVKVFDDMSCRRHYYSEDEDEDED